MLKDMTIKTLILMSRRWRLPNDANLCLSQSN